MVAGGALQSARHRGFSAPFLVLCGMAQGWVRSKKELRGEAGCFAYSLLRMQDLFVMIGLELC